MGAQQSRQITLLKEHPLYSSVLFDSTPARVYPVVIHDLHPSYLGKIRTQWEQRSKMEECVVRVLQVSSEEQGWSCKSNRVFEVLTDDVQNSLSLMNLPKGRSGQVLLQVLHACIYLRKMYNCSFRLTPELIGFSNNKVKLWFHSNFSQNEPQEPLRRGDCSHTMAESIIDSVRSCCQGQQLSQQVEKAIRQVALPLELENIVLKLMSALT